MAAPSLYTDIRPFFRDGTHGMSESRQSGHEIFQALRAFRP